MKGMPKLKMPLDCCTDSHTYTYICFVMVRLLEKGLFHRASRVEKKKDHDKTKKKTESHDSPQGVSTNKHVKI